MYKPVLTLTDFVINEEHRTTGATGSFTLLISEIENVTKIIASHVKASGLVDILGKTGAINTFGEDVQKLDEFSNQIISDTLANCGQVFAIISEEMEKPLFSPKERSGKYIVYIDPLDGSSNIDTNSPVGTIFSIYKRGTDENVLFKGSEQVAAGYVIYGSSVMFVYTSGHGVNGFTLDPAVGNFLLSHPNIKIPQSGEVYSINEANAASYDDKTKNYLQKLKDQEQSRARYVGSLVADAHRTFIKGGIFLYPADKKQPDGKLRLMLEVNPFAMLTKQAEGKTLGKNNLDPLEAIPNHTHERSPFIMGSQKNVEEYLLTT